MPPVALPRHHAGFALDLLRLLARDRPAENLAWSPYSVTAALRLAADGARGDTHAEIAAVIGPPEETARLVAAAGAAGGVEVANTLWADTTLPVEAAYESAVRGRPGGGVRAADFRGDPEGARRAVNAEVEKSTRGWIRELLGPGTVGTDTLAIIVNALYARLAWLQEFDPADTRDRPFHAPGGVRAVPTMARQGYLTYAAVDGWRLVSLPSRSTGELSGADGAAIRFVTAGELVLDVLLPGTGGLTALGPESLARLYRAASHVPVDLRLPRFGVAYGTELSTALAAMGVRTLFTGGADLSGISRRPLKIDQVIHRAVLTVDEKGAEGAAATALAVAGGAYAEPPAPVEMHVDRPFLVMVRHVATGAIYFAAQVTEP